MKKPSIFISIFAILTIFAAGFFYFDYKKNPITYIILSKKFELVSYLFFRDISDVYPRYDSYSIAYQNLDYDKDLDSHFAKENSVFSIFDLQSIYKTNIPHKLRKIFNDYAKLNPAESKDIKIVENVFGVDNVKGRFSYRNSIFHGVTPYEKAMRKRVEKLITIFGKKFIVTAISQYKEDAQCGKNSYDVEIIFDSKSIESMTIGLRNSGEICFIWDEKLRFSQYEIMDFKQKYKNYWF